MEADAPDVPAAKAAQALVRHQETGPGDKREFLAYNKERAFSCPFFHFCLSPKRGICYTTCEAERFGRKYGGR